MVNQAEQHRGHLYLSIEEEKKKPDLAIFTFQKVSSVVFFLLFLSGFFVVPLFSQKQSLFVIVPPLVFLILFLFLFAKRYFVINLTPPSWLRDEMGKNVLYYSILISTLLFVCVWDFSLLSSGSFRCGWDPGAISGSNLTSSFVLSNYLSKFPNNILLASFNYCIYQIGSLFGLQDSYFLLQMLNVVALLLSTLMLTLAIRKSFGRKWSLVSLPFSVVLIGITPWALVPYSDTSALFLITLFLFAISIWKLKKQNMCFLGILCIISYAVKPTTVFLYIALWLVFVISCKKNKASAKKDFRKVLYFLLGIFIGFLAVNMIEAPLKVNLQLDSSREIGFSHFLMMGAHGDGGWNQDDYDFSNQFSTREERFNSNLEEYKKTVERLGVSGLLSLYWSKALRSFNDGSFFWAYEGSFFLEVRPYSFPFSSFYYLPSGVDQNNNNEFMDSYSQRENPYSVLANVAWCVVLGFASFGIFSRKNTKLLSWTTCLYLASLFLVGFLMVFEARSRYVILFLPVFIYLCIFGWRCFSVFFRKKKAENYCGKEKRFMNLYQQKLSIVIPCYNEEQTLEAFCKELSNVFKKLQANYPALGFEVVFVNDGSKDKTLEIIKHAPKTTGLSGISEVHYLSFSRNFGKEAAMYAGLQTASGTFVTTMDADLQDPPALLEEMLPILFTGKYDSVAMRRVSRKGEPPIRSFFARTFYKLINKISDADIVDGARDYRLMTRQMVDAVLSLHERNRFTKGIFGWVGFNTYWFEYEHTDRIAGETKFSFWGLFKYAIEGIVSFSSTPLALASAAGVIISFVAVIFMIILLIRAAVFGDPVSGWPSLMCTVLFVGGLQLLGIGILGAYLARTYTETKKRPIYIVKDEGHIE